MLPFSRWFVVIAVALLSGCTASLGAIPQPNTLSTSAPASPNPAATAPLSPVACTNDAAFVVDVTYPDGSVVAPGVDLMKTWRVRNTGTCTWDGNYSLVKVSQPNGLVVGPSGCAERCTVASLPVTAPGAPADITVSITLSAMTSPGETYRADFHLIAPDGVRFGTNLIAVFEMQFAPNACTNAAALIGSMTYDDGAVVPIGTAFDKTWQVQNTGTCTWTAPDYQLVISPNAGSIFVQPGCGEVCPPISLPRTVQPGEIVEISAPLGLSMMSTIGESYSAQFVLVGPDPLFPNVNASGTFGPQLSVRVVAGS